MSQTQSNLVQINELHIKLNRDRDREKRERMGDKMEDITTSSINLGVLAAEAEVNS